MPMTTQDVQLVAPQFSYYGLDTVGVVRLGGEAWAEPEVRRLVEPRFLNQVIVATPRDTGAFSARERFVQRYEERYRRSLDNPFPALGYDAARLALLALVPGQNRPEQVAERMRRIDGYEGATGTISVIDGEVTRRVHLVVLDGSRMLPAPPPEMLLPPPPLWTDTTGAGAAAGTGAGRGR